jgi:hypothetical protein
MRRYPVSIAIVAFSVFMLITGYLVYRNTELARLHQVMTRKKAPSQIYAHLLVQYDKPPVLEEEYSMQDIEGVSTFQYRIRSYAGKQVTLTVPPSVITDVSYFYGKLDQDGVWQIVNQPDRGKTSPRYTVYVKQLADFKQGDRTITFTDPKYWATTAGHQFNIDLSKNSPNDILKMQSTQLADKRYLIVVNDFLKFGPDSFRKRVARLRAQFGLKATP